MQIAQLLPLNPDGAPQVVWKGCRGTRNNLRHGTAVSTDGTLELVPARAHSSVDPLPQEMPLQQRFPSCLQPQDRFLVPNGDKTHPVMRWMCWRGSRGTLTVGKHPVPHCRSAPMPKETSEKCRAGDTNRRQGHTTPQSRRIIKVG